MNCDFQFFISHCSVIVTHESHIDLQSVRLIVSFMNVIYGNNAICNRNWVTGMLS